MRSGSMPCGAMQSRMELCGAGRGHAGPCEHIRGHVGRQHGNSVIRRCLVGPRGGKMKNDFSRLILSRASLTPARDKISLEKWLIGRVHPTALGVVVPPIIPTGYSPPVPGCCGASIATGDGSCSLPHAVLGDAAAAAARSCSDPPASRHPARPARSTARIHSITPSHPCWSRVPPWSRETVGYGAVWSRGVRHGASGWSTVRVCDGRARSAARTVEADGKRRFRDTKRDAPC